MATRKIEGSNETLAAVAFASSHDAAFWDGVRNNAHSTRIVACANKETAFHINRAQRIANELIARMKRAQRYN
jgi:hypothetical protein